MTWPSVSRNIYKERGLKGFFSGLSASYYGASETATHFIIYEKLKQELKGTCTYTLGAMSFLAESFLSATLAKVVACSIAYPHEVIRTRMRETPCSSHSLISYQSFWPSYFSILKYEGVTGLYRGYAAHLARVLPNSAVVFITYEAIVHCFNS
ncbi:solute carrier family 25 member 36-like [Zophobas morio]|jgi:solute carrier family 25 protein 33/36|uniref:solute carrier family 25 member 36-like n=1 Tax=Zophobas morio TaxID=2755281 RepID=UPI003082F232